MLWQPAVVLERRSGQVRVGFDRLEHCQRCLQGEGCGAGLFSQLFVPRSATLWLRSSQDWRVGSRIRVGLPPRQLMLAALTLYGLPLVGMLVGMICASSMALGELGVLAVGLAGAVLALRLSRPIQKVICHPVIEAWSDQSGCAGLESGQ